METEDWSFLIIRNLMDEVKRLKDKYEPDPIRADPSPTVGGTED